MNVAISNDNCLKKWGVDRVQLPIFYACFFTILQPVFTKEKMAEGLARNQVG